MVHRSGQHKIPTFIEGEKVVDLETNDNYIVLTNVEFS